MELSELFKLLGDETRLRILLLLGQQSLCVCELCGILGMAQPRVSKTLAKLKDLGLVTMQREDKFIRYTLKTTTGLCSDVMRFLLQHEQVVKHPVLLRDREALANRSRFSAAWAEGEVSGG